MIALVQRVAEAAIEADGATIARGGAGLLVLVGVERGDTERQAERLAARVASFRVFEDASGRMNRSLLDTGGDLVAAPNFTLAADTSKGTRASFSAAAAPDEAEPLFACFVEALRAAGVSVQTGRFGAHMRIMLVNDGPVSFILRV